MKHLFFYVALLCWASHALSAQKTFTMTEAFQKRMALSPSSLRQPKWIPGTNQLTHVHNNRLVRVSADNLTTDTLDLLTTLNEQMQILGQTTLSTLPVFEWLGKEELWFNKGGTLFHWSAKTGLTQKNNLPNNAENVDIHTQSYQAAYTVDNELRICVEGKEQTIARSEADGIIYGKSVHRDEFGISKGTYWSPSGRALAFYRMDEQMVTAYPIYILDSMPAVAKTIRYPYAGAASHQVTIGVYDLKKNATIYLNTGTPSDQYLTNIAWTPDEKSILVAVVNREQNHCWLRQYDAQTGALLATLFEEIHDKWVEPEQPARFVPGSKTRFVWQSERDGFNHLYLYDLKEGLIRQLSKGNFPVTTFYGFSENGALCFYQTADETGLHRFGWATSLKDGKANCLNSQAGTHQLILHPEGSWVMDYFSNATTPRTIYVQKTIAGAAPSPLFSAPNPLEGYKIGTTQLISIPSKGGMNLNGRLILPSDYQPSQKYPALIYVYNGPHAQMVTNTWLGGGELWMHRLANEGYIVLSVDGRGSAHRGREFEQAIFRQLGDVEMEDQLSGVEYLKNNTAVDPSRIGVYGWSYGGFMATSLLTRPEAKGVFKCGIAGGPVLDWRMYEIMYTERYMDTPAENPEGYQKNTLFGYIDNLEGSLLMIHGTSDPVVLWQHSLKYIRECVKKGKQIDYFVYPEHEHNVIGPDRAHLFEKIERFIKAEL
jgi:dipeptidyl-peptidase-4